ncbi:hypothetical protein ADIS_3558 [Lunatimonas lonarensis]|uniref:Uncharacterized protein n=1 Tax=Lunatimonas lonarensis TaxID=1232681 RepID=R7ZPE5_9BACT|nr:hypothetical protein ADIS_3558 [Lunatimonas lonarensis]
MFIHSYQPNTFSDCSVTPVFFEIRLKYIKAVQSENLHGSAMSDPAFPNSAYGYL